MRKTIAGLAILLSAVSMAANAQGHLQYFGYDNGAVTSADLTQTYSYTNVAVTNPDCQGSSSAPYVCGSCQSIPSVVGTVNAMAAKGVKAIVDLAQVFFCATAATGGHWTLRSDYATAWQSFRTANATVLDAGHVASLYVMDEPTLNGVTFSELSAATTAVKQAFPTIPTSMVEAYVSVSGLIIPSNMDWIGIDQYAVGDPATDLTYQNQLQILKSKLNSTQKVIYVMDAFFDPSIHGTANMGAGWTPSQLSCVATRWYNLAAADPAAVLLAAFIWDGTSGSENLPQSARDLQAKAGGAVTGKSLVETIFTRQVPTSNLTGTPPYEDGTQFSSSQAGTISAIRYYKPVGETGTHVGRIWDDATGTLLASVTFAGETASDWQTQSLVTPLAISANHKYRVSYNFNTNLSKTVSGLASPISNGTLTAFFGCYSTPAGTFPSTLSVGNYFADVVFHPNSLPAYSCTPSYQGYHDGDGCSTISGWAWDSNPLNPSVGVDLYKDGSLLAAQLPAKWFRQDLLNAGIGNGYHAFVYSVPTSLSDGQPHLIRAKVANTQTDLSWTPRWITCGGSHAPYHGSPSAVPGTIQAEDFDTGGEGNGYHDTEAANLGGQYRPAEGVDLAACTDGAGCYDVGWAKAGEWLLYTVSVPTAGTYTLQVRVASAGAGGTFHVELNGTNKTGALTVPNTGGWDTWQTVSKTVTLDAGWQALKLVMDTTGATGYVGNFNYLKF
jgi:hypothetical protein